MRLLTQTVIANVLSWLVVLVIYAMFGAAIYYVAWLLGREAGWL